MTVFEGRLFPKEAADAIGIAPATLRKYSQIVEEVLDNSNFFSRTEQNNRTYSSKNIELLKKISHESSETKKPVKTIVETLKKENAELFEDSEKVVENKKPQKIQQSKQNAPQIQVQEFLNIIQKQDQKIDQLMQMVASLSTELKEVKPMIEQSNNLLENHSTINSKTTEEKEVHNDKDLEGQKSEKTEENNEQELNNDNQKAPDSNSNDTEKTNESTEKTNEKIGFFKRLFGNK